MHSCSKKRTPLPRPGARRRKSEREMGAVDANGNGRPRSRSPLSRDSAIWGRTGSLLANDGGQLRTGVARGIEMDGGRMVANQQRRAVEIAKDLSLDESVATETLG